MCSYVFCDEECCALVAQMNRLNDAEAKLPTTSQEGRAVKFLIMLNVFKNIQGPFTGKPDFFTEHLLQY